MSSSGVPSSGPQRDVLPDPVRPHARSHAATVDPVATRSPCARHTHCRPHPCAQDRDNLVTSCCLPRCRRPQRATRAPRRSAATARRTAREAPRDRIRNQAVRGGGAGGGRAGPPGPARALPVLAEQPADPLQPLGHRVHVHVQHLGGAGRAAAGAEVLLQGGQRRCRAGRRSPAPGRACVGRSRRRPGRPPSSRPTKPRSATPAPVPRGPARPAPRRSARPPVRRRTPSGPGRARPAPAVTGPPSPRRAPREPPRGRVAGSSPGSSSTSRPVATAASPPRSAAWSSPRRRPLPQVAGPRRTTTRVRRVQVDAEPAGPLAQPVRVARGAASRSSSSSPRTRPSASATVRRNSSSSAVTSAARSRIRWSALGQLGRPGAAPARRAARAPAATAATTRRRAARSGRRPGRAATASATAAGRVAASPTAASTPAVGVQHQQRAAEHVGHRGGDVLHAAAAQHQVGHPVVRRGGPLHRRRCARRIDRLAVVSSSSAARVSCSSRALSIATAACAASDAEQRHLVPGERPVAAVGGEQHADHPRAEPQRHAEDRDQPLLADRRVDLAGVLEPGVRRSSWRSRTAWRSARPARRARPPSAAAAAGTWPRPSRRSPACRCRRAPRRCSVRYATSVPSSCRARRTIASQHRVQVPQRGEVAGGVEQRGQLRLAPPPALQQRPHLQREHLGPLQLVDLGRRRPAARAPPAAARTRPRRPRGQQLEESAAAMAPSCARCGLRPVSARSTRRPSRTTCR